MILREVNRVGEVKKNIPKLRFKGYEDAWEQRKLGEILKERTERAEGDEELLSVTINKGVIRQLESDKRNISSENKSNYKLVYKGDIPYNSMRMWQGAVGVSQFEGIVSPAYTVLIPTEKADGKFLMELFKKSSSLQIFTRWSQGLTSDTWNLKYPTLSKISFFVPYIKEQNKIAKLLQELDDLITLHQRKYDALKSMKKTLLSKMFPKNGEDVPEIRFKGFTNAWEQRKLGDIADKVTVKNSNLQYIETFTNSAEVGIISQRDYFDHDIANLSNLDGYYIVQKEDFVYNPRISTSAPVGPINRNKLGRVGVMSPLYTVFRTHNVDTTYLEYYFKSQYWHSFMKFHGDSGARADRFSIKDAIFFEMPIPLPDIDEQQKIGDYLNSVDYLITLHQRNLEELKKMKKTLLQQMFV